MSRAVAARSASPKGGPVLVTERLRLRRHQADDFAASAHMWANPAVTRYIGGRPFSEEESWSRLLRYAGHWALLGFGYWVVEEVAAGTFVGEVGFGHFRRDLQPPLIDTPELGWAFIPDVHGRGYATESVGAALAWADLNIPAKNTACLIHPANLASLRVAAKCGYVPTGTALYRGQTVSIFHRPNPRPILPQSAK